jgi:dolichol-phosphate mannosyltransferase
MTLENSKIEISVVIPVYMGAQTIDELYSRLVRVLKTVASEKSIQIVLVDDYSLDDTWQKILNIAHSDKRVVAIKLSRNFGQHAALTAGLSHADGKWIIIMDCDLQDVPEEIPKLFNFTKNGYQVIVGVKKSRNDPRFKILTSHFFSYVYRMLTNSNLKSRVGNFGVYSRSVIQSILSMPEQNRSFGLLSLWVGFDRKEVLVEHAPRTLGKSNYNFRKRYKLAMDSLLSYSNKVLNFNVYIGLIVTLVSSIAAVGLLVRFLFHGNSASGWTSLAILILFSVGVQLTALGVLALYIGKIYDEVKRRPLYLIDKIYSEGLGKHENR